MLIPTEPLVNASNRHGRSPRRYAQLASKPCNPEKRIPSMQPDGILEPPKEEPDGAGLLVTVDELHAGDTEELRTLGVVMQEVTRVGQLPMAFVGAGLPILEDTLLADASVTFLQRCARYEIGFLDPAAAWVALSEPVRQHGGHMAAEAVEHAVAVSQGYPFMVQLVGFHAWEAASDPASAVTPRRCGRGCGDSSPPDWPVGDRADVERPGHPKVPDGSWLPWPRTTGRHELLTSRLA